MPDSSARISSLISIPAFCLFIIGCGQQQKQGMSTLTEYTRSDLSDSYEDPVLSNFNNVSRPDLVQKIVKLTFQTERGSSRCSGTIVSPKGLILTATHCIDDLIGDVTVYIGGSEESYKATLLENWPYATIDAAFLEIQDRSRKFPYATLADRLPREGEDIFSINFPFGQLNQSKGKVISAKSESRTKNWLVTTAFVGPGSSGGAFFDNQGRQIGLSNSQDDNPQTGKVNVGSGDAVYSIVYERWRKLVGNLTDDPSRGETQTPATDQNKSTSKSPPGAPAETAQNDSPKDGCWDGNDNFHPVGKIFVLYDGRRMICRSGGKWDYL